MAAIVVVVALMPVPVDTAELVIVKAVWPEIDRTPPALVLIVAVRPFPLI